MSIKQSHLFVGAPRDATLAKTLQVICGKLTSLGRFRGDKMLDVGCGEGSFTRVLGREFREVHGIDVQQDFLDTFRKQVEGASKYHIHNMSASDMRFPDSDFDTIVSIETLEHVPDLESAAKEMVRVLKPGGELLITVPNRWFPFENHGIVIGNWEKHTRIPLLTYCPPLHDRFSLARVFTVKKLDHLFQTRGLTRHGVDYAWPTFEHAGNPLQRFFKPLFGVMRFLEASPLKCFGSSVIVCYRKP